MGVTPSVNAPAEGALESIAEETLFFVSSLGMIVTSVPCPISHVSYEQFCLSSYAL